MNICLDSALNMYWTYDWCWLWANIYLWNRDSFMSNLLYFVLQLIFYLKSLIQRIKIYFKSILSLWVFFVILEHYKRKSFSKSSQICGQVKTRQLKFKVIVNIYSRVKFLSSPALYTNSKYVSYVSTVLDLCILTSIKYLRYIHILGSLVK